MSPGSSTESYPAFAHIRLRENTGKNLNQVACPDRESNTGHLVSRSDALTWGRKNNAETDQKEEKELVGFLAEKKLPTEGCIGRNGERDKKREHKGPKGLDFWDKLYDYHAHDENDSSAHAMKFSGIVSCFEGPTAMRAVPPRLHLDEQGESLMGKIIDPTIRFETYKGQPEDVHEEKRAIYVPTIPYYKDKYQLHDISVTGLMFGTRGMILNFSCQSSVAADGYAFSLSLLHDGAYSDTFLARYPYQRVLMTTALKKYPIIKA
ncbi:hypothetical protein ANN_22344 [Periplaneta americana]|uniref:Uncharacterized protein n=1 Tax=Periplaneta americana TaxID=6978 RepID=A0ABQ8S7W9_PERAM|nr:hypothetical protein ANN_22344 [Periplaneta americana]